MIWYLIKYNSQGFWTEVSIETSYASADARKEFLESKQTNSDGNHLSNISYLIVSSPQGKQYLPQIVEYKLSQLKQQVA